MAIRAPDGANKLYSSCECRIRVLYVNYIIFDYIKWVPLKAKKMGLPNPKKSKTAQKATVPVCHSVPASHATKWWRGAAKQADIQNRIF